MRSPSLSSRCAGSPSALTLAGDNTPRARESESSLGFRPLRELFGRYVATAPLAHALFRAAECVELSTQSIRRPVLDLGCGTGEFAKCALTHPPDVAVDVRKDRLLSTQQAVAWQSAACADARRLPFHDGAFASVLAVSVLEHVESPGEALNEISRVLRPGGRFIATIVLKDLHRHLLHPRWLGALGLGRLGLAKAYLAAHDRAFRHCCLLEREEWHEMLSRAGLQVVVSRRIVGPRITQAFDALLATAWPYRLMQAANRYWLWRPKWAGELAWKLFQRLAERDAADVPDTAAGDQDCRAGSVLLIVAEKPHAENGPCASAS